jgi:hypothetical protein
MAGERHGMCELAFRVPWTLRLLQMRGVCCLETSGTKYPVLSVTYQKSGYILQDLVCRYLVGILRRELVHRKACKNTRWHRYKRNVGIYQRPDWSSHVLSQCLTCGRQCIAATARHAIGSQMLGPPEIQGTASIYHRIAFCFVLVVRVVETGRRAGYWKPLYFWTWEEFILKFAENVL